MIYLDFFKILFSLDFSYCILKKKKNYTFLRSLVDTFKYDFKTKY